MHIKQAENMQNHAITVLYMYKEKRKWRNREKSIKRKVTLNYILWLALQYTCDLTL